MKSKKLSLDQLKVKSFVTDFQGNKENTLKGGGGLTTFTATQATDCCTGEHCFLSHFKNCPQ